MQIIATGQANNGLSRNLGKLRADLLGMTIRSAATLINRLNTAGGLFQFALS